ncbi:MAG: transposase [Candidatus Protochlamydia sp.]|nr:transposase [Candidatus Protochlamydia sp.]
MGLYRARKAISIWDNWELRDECLNENLFMSLKDAEKKVEEWRFEYTEERPHSSLMV